MKNKRETEKTTTRQRNTTEAFKNIFL